MTKAYISVYLRNSEEGPSCYYRIMQYINEIDGYEFKINNAFTTKEYRKNMNLKSVFFKKIYQLILLVKVMYRRYRDIISKICFSFFDKSIIRALKLS